MRLISGKFAVALCCAGMGASAVAQELPFDPVPFHAAAHKDHKGDPGAPPPDYLYQVPDRSQIQDEPLKVEVPKGLNELVTGANVPAVNPLTKGKYELGRQLYFDPRLSVDGTVSCATCHNPDKGWTDNLPVSFGFQGKVGGRSAPTVINTVYGQLMFWDGRAPSLEAQSQGPILNAVEMACKAYDDVVHGLRKVPGYQEQFKKVFGTDVTLDGIAKAIATFERVAALSGNSRYDRYVFGELDILNESEKRGLVLFGLSLRGDDETEINVERQKAKCSLCHVGANFTDEKFHNLGAGWEASTRTFKDLGRWAEVPIGAKSDADIGAFKTPTLRDIARTGPYMHDGSEKTLEEVVEFYDKGGNANPFLDRDMKPLKLTPQEKADVVAFMKALTGETKTTAELLPKLPAGPDGAAPDPLKALTAPVAPKTATN
jgi:cytochrome c peroxidase